MTESNLQVHGQNLLYYGGATILGTAAAVLTAKASWHVGKGVYSVSSWGLSHSWNATKWIARNGWNTTKATPGAAWEATKWTAGTAWSATKWTASTGFSIAKYVLVNIPTAIKWTALTAWGAAKWSANTAWSCTKWAFSCIRHPIDSIQNAFDNTLALYNRAWNLGPRVINKTAELYKTYVLPAINDFVDFMVESAQSLYQFGSKHVKIMAHDLNEAFPITGRIATRVQGYALTAFGFVSSKATTIAKKVLPYNPVPWLFEKAPSMQTPTYVAMGAAASSLAADMVSSNIGAASHLITGHLDKAEYQENVCFENMCHRFKLDLFIMTIGTIMLAPRIANYFSKHTVTQMQATGWGLTFLAMKTISNFDYEEVQQYGNSRNF
ncbi:hypothetical protein [Candidatus Neptunichlamydia sp. REUL1]|uniref:hypothetical protein n=1 Tax=Candidatus Neptunichlamydia sp. REUL1 TaxID=3064277 RepID=UPI002930C822|nr:hypothetical protein [Candidatus Neptunochlamydia sp. REUL1]